MRNFPTQMVERDQFIAWSEGVLLDLNLLGAVVVNEALAEAAQAALERGEVVGLTKDGRLVSTMRLHKDAFIEEELP